eukprot:12291983-Prorocentrum_lima.AAC.1
MVSLALRTSSKVSAPDDIQRPSSNEQGAPHAASVALQRPSSKEQGVLCAAGVGVGAAPAPNT